VSEERVAGRKAVLLAIRPHDEFRYGHRLWLDIETGFPLQTKLMSNDGATIEQVQFADISLDQEIHASALAPSTSIENFRWFTQPQREINHVVDSPWNSDVLPAGFRVISTHGENLPGRDVPVIHILYSDGLANVSVFIEPANDKKFARRSRVGASNSYSVENGGYQVTAVGEVPAATVEKIATSMQPN
jgi:sigma-E factor negative regulatory protein RseB